MLKGVLHALFCPPVSPKATSMRSDSSELFLLGFFKIEVCTNRSAIFDKLIKIKEEYLENNAQCIQIVIKMVHLMRTIPKKKLGRHLPG